MHKNLIKCLNKKSIAVIAILLIFACNSLINYVSRWSGLCIFGCCVSFKNFRRNLFLRSTKLIPHQLFNFRAACHDSLMKQWLIKFIKLVHAMNLSKRQTQVKRTMINFSILWFNCLLWRRKVFWNASDVCWCFVAILTYRLIDWFHSIHFFHLLSPLNFILKESLSSEDEIRMFQKVITLVPMRTEKAFSQINDKWQFIGEANLRWQVYSAFYDDRSEVLGLYRIFQLVEDCAGEGRAYREMTFAFLSRFPSSGSYNRKELPAIWCCSNNSHSAIGHAISAINMQISICR